MTNKKTMSTKSMVLTAVLTALIVILQLLGAFVRFGPFSISLVLVPIVIGAALCGVGAGAWLGLAFGVTVLLSGDAAAFMAISIPGTIATVLAKGVLCGLCAGLSYKALSRYGRYVAVIGAAIVCPVVNTGVFLLGCFAFFMQTLSQWAGGQEMWQYIIFVLVGGNFLFELGSNVILSPVIVRLLDIGSKRM